MMLEEKLRQSEARETNLKEKLKIATEEVDERDSVILEMKKRLECEETDQIIFEAKIKQLEHDLQQQRQ